jgi:hypothetical protein
MGVRTMLTFDPEIVCYLIVKAREFQAKEEVVLPDVPDNPSEDWALQVLADHVDDLSVQEASTILADLDPEQRAEVVALMWLGRGDYDLDEWDAAVSDALEASTDRTWEYLLAHPLVADYLEEGLIEHGYSCEE